MELDSPIQGVDQIVIGPVSATGGQKDLGGPRYAQGAQLLNLVQGYWCMLPDQPVRSSHHYRAHGSSSTSPAV
jgi:hypothetical protein